MSAIQTVQAPHPTLQDALFCYATGDDGASAELIRGWPALVTRVVSDVAGDGWAEILADLDDWSNDGWGVPYRYSVNFEDGYMAIYRICEAASERAAPRAAPAGVSLTDHHKLDNDKQVFFYEQDFYVLSNFSSFNLEWNGLTFPTSEHAYHWEKFASDELGLPGGRSDIAHIILTAPSAHEAFKIAERMKAQRRADWDAVKVGIMRDILRAKAQQHEYVHRKLLATGDRELIEDSWRDDYWGWGPNRDGQNMLGKLWMEVRAELRAATPSTATKEQQ